MIKKGERRSVAGGGVTLVGVISDTHGLLRPEAVNALRGSQLIIHAGDVGRPEVLEALREVAPVIVVKGNVDTASWARALPAHDFVDVEGHVIYVLHNLSELDVDPVAAGISVVVSGHTHTPMMEWRRGVLFLNPGSAGPRRFTLPITVARLSCDAREIRAELIHPLQAS